MGLLALAALTVAGCDPFSNDQLPPRSLLGERVAVEGTVMPIDVRLIQLAKFFDDGSWKRMDDGSYTLRVTRTDPTSDKVTKMGFLIQEADDGSGEKVANITHATVDGEDVPQMQLLYVLEGWQLPPLPAEYAAQTAAQPPPPSPAPTTHPPADLSAFRPGMSYAEAREKLGLLAIKPAPIPRPSGDDSCGPGEQEICKDYPEIIDCTGTGMNPCRAAFIDLDGRIAVASTEGDEATSLTLTGLAWANAEDQKRVRNIIAGRAENAS